MKRQHTELENIFANYIPTRDLYLGQMENFYNSIIKRLKNPIKKRAKDFNRYFSKEAT